MKRFFLRNIGWKVLSLALAFVLWLGMAREPEVATTYSAPIEFKNMPDDLDIVSDVPARVRLELRGPAPSLERNLGSVAVLLDLGAIQPGVRTFPIQTSNVVRLPMDVACRRAVPSQVTLRFEHDLTRDVPVEISTLR